ITQTLVAEAYMLTGRRAEAVVWADRALDLAAVLGRPELRPRALVAKGSAMVNDGEHTEEGAAILRDAAAEAEVHGDDVSLTRALFNSIHNSAVNRPVAEVWVMVQRIRDVAERA